MKIKIKQSIITCNYAGQEVRDKNIAKKRIKEDCSHRCAYCDDFDGHLGYKFFHLEHFAPKKKFPELEYSYNNFLYACPFCNWAKSDKWYGNNSNESISENKGFINPKNLNLYEQHLKRNNDGSIGFLSELGESIYNDLKLFLPRHQLSFNIDRALSIRQMINALEDKYIDFELQILKKDLNDIIIDYYELMIENNSTV